MSNQLLRITAEEWRKRAHAAHYHARDLAKFCCVSLRTLERHFHETKGQCPQEWLDKERMRAARELLCAHNNVKETAGHLGFKSSQHFSKTFKKHNGHSPRHHSTVATKKRKRHKKEKGRL